MTWREYFRDVPAEHPAITHVELDTAAESRLRADGRSAERPVGPAVADGWRR